MCSKIGSSLSVSLSLCTNRPAFQSVSSLESCPWEVEKSDWLPNFLKVGARAYGRVSTNHRHILLTTCVALPLSWRSCECPVVEISCHISSAIQTPLEISSRALGSQTNVLSISSMANGNRHGRRGTYVRLGIQWSLYDRVTKIITTGLFFNISLVGFHTKSLKLLFFIISESAAMCRRKWMPVYKLKAEIWYPERDCPWSGPLHKR